MKEKRHTCTFPLCPKSYSTNWNLNQHITRFHMELKQFRCPHCSKSFASRQNLNQHSNIHSGAKPFQCMEPGCSEAFRYGSQLWQHKRLHKALKSESSLKKAVLSLTDLLILSFSELCPCEDLETTGDFIRNGEKLTARLSSS